MSGEDPFAVNGVLVLDVVLGRSIFAGELSVPGGAVRRGREAPNRVEIESIKRLLTPGNLRPNTDSAPGVLDRIACGAAGVRQERDAAGKRVEKLLEDGTVIGTRMDVHGPHRAAALMGRT
jgi:hypothetical protein